MSTAQRHDAVTVLVTEQLVDDLEGKVSREEIEEVVEAHAEDFADAKVPTFVSTFVARRAREDLRRRIREAYADGGQNDVAGDATRART